ncbi:unnamed protein product [Penicillium camemberti]|uniref:Str. FM013 n=1 Tax=Penicillium camemberti (strain FM 013) TaxID=1429867 RepID=A0A0G4PGG9_PENC3|nr:unnamed protein product [Penicillium camemberti]
MLHLHLTSGPAQKPEAQPDPNPQMAMGLSFRHGIEFYKPTNEEFH